MAEELAKRIEPTHALGAQDGVGGLEVRILCLVDGVLGLREILRGSREHAGGIGAGALGGLCRHQRMIDPACLHEALVGTGLHETPVVQDDQAVGADDARQPMGKNEGGAPLHEPVQGLLDDRLVLGVHGRQRLVEHQDRRVAQQRPGDGDALTLPAGETDAALADDGPVTLGQLHDEPVCVGGAGRGLELFPGGIGLSETQVVLDAAVEEIGVLIYDGDVAVQIRGAKAAQIAPADAHAALLRVVEAQQQAHDARLAGAAGADEPDPLPGGYLEAQVPVRLAPPAGVGEAHVLEGDRWGEHPLDGLEIVSGRDGGFRFQDGQDALRRREPHHALMEERAKVPLRPVHLDAHHEDDEQDLEAHAAFGHAIGAVAEGRGGPDGEASIDDAPGQGVGGEHPHGGAEQLVGLLGEQPGSRAALAEGLESGEALDRVQEFGSECGVSLLAA